MEKRTFGLLALVLLAAFAAGCSALPQQVSQAGPRSWIDTPLDSSITFTDPLHPGDPIPPGDPIHPGAPIHVISHSTDLFRVVEVELSINGQVIHSDPSPNQDQGLPAMTQTWTPTAPGNYTLRVRARNSNGVWGDYAQVVVTVGGAGAPPTTAPVVAAVPATTTPAPVVAAVPATTTPTPIVAGVPATATPLRAPPPSCSGTPVIASFSATSTQINAGSSTTLQWGAVTNADSVQIDQGIGGVVAPGSAAVSPGSITTYTLTARCGGNAATRQVTVAVNAAPPQQPPASSAIKQGNLIVNGDAEANGQNSASNDTANPAPLNWSPFVRTAAATIVRYAAPGGFPDKNSPGPSNRGNNFFAGGPGVGTSEATQTIDLSSWGADAFALIDGSKVSYQFGAWLGGFADQDDNATVGATFLGANSNTLGQATLMGPNAAARNNKTGLVSKNTSGKVPAGTRKIEIVIRFTRAGASGYNDGYADDLSLTLSSQ